MWEAELWYTSIMDAWLITSIYNFWATAPTKGGKPQIFQPVARCFTLKKKFQTGVNYRFISVTENTKKFAAHCFASHWIALINLAEEIADLMSVSVIKMSPAISQ